ncbi:MAG: glycosyltransferase [Chroococcus sp. CMT-3BRIN-NPC107]|jgi:hypothetical protein|nr:glycosyltransferase [Chroococcus sp. CMT-3BRIN-NPC107]
MKNYFEQEKQLLPLKNFDCIFMNLSLSIEAVANTTQKPCYYLPPGTDAVNFCPYPLLPQRSVNVCSFGRRPLSVHKELLKLEEQEDFLYMYDTLQYLFVDNYESHRALYQRVIKRSKYFIAYGAKFDSKSEVGAQEELNIRFFEGAAGGAVILGKPPKNVTFTQNFDWKDAVIDLSADATNIREFIADLNAQTERLEEIRKNNVVTSLLRHDWVYRWEQILDKVGLSHTPKMAQRHAYLRSLADMALQKSSKASALFVNSTNE